MREACTPARGRARRRQRPCSSWPASDSHGIEGIDGGALQPLRAVSQGPAPTGVFRWPGRALSAEDSRAASGPAFPRHLPDGRHGRGQAALASIPRELPTRWASRRLVYIRRHVILPRAAARARSGARRAAGLRRQAKGEPHDACRPLWRRARGGSARRVREARIGPATSNYGKSGVIAASHVAVTPPSRARRCRGRRPARARHRTAEPAGGLDGRATFRVRRGPARRSSSFEGRPVENPTYKDHERRGVPTCCAARPARRLARQPRAQPVDP